MVSVRRAVRPILLLVLVAAAASAAAGCRSRSESARDPEQAAPAAAPADPNAAPARPKIVVLGDSLTAGYGLLETQSYPSILQQHVDRDGYEFEVVNAGVSGDTSAGALRRLDWALEGNVKVLIVALGGNDGLRGLSVAQMKDNLSQIVARAREKNVVVILAGMEAPPNYGRDYIVSFHKVYPALAEQYKVALVPFLLQNVAGFPDMNQPDGIHPTAAGARVVADNVWAVLKPLAEDAR
jgi:acyl-CoA thioesterase I